MKYVFAFGSFEKKRITIKILTSKCLNIVNFGSVGTTTYTVF